MTVGDLTPTRDFIDVRDVASALLTLASPNVRKGTYNVASGEECSIAHLFDLLVDIAGLRNGITIEHRYVRASDTPRAVADVERLNASGYRPAFTLEQSLRDLFTYYREAAFAQSVA
jgi:GDP-4-dehydro-6-deoxy-D-mannose reductase